MQSLWNDQEAGTFSGDLARRVYTSRLLGQNPSLVLHGGGNTSVKIRETNLFGEEEDILYVKGSGWDLATIEAAGFAPARVAYERMIELVSLAEQYLADHAAWRIEISPIASPERPLRHDLAALRRDVAGAAGAPVILAAHTDEQSLAFARRDDLALISQQGPATPDHIIRTKRLPQIGRDVAAYADAYRHY